jgi:hypothetical protein
MVGGFSAVLPKLLKLVECEAPSVRIPACEALVENAFIGQDMCIRDPGIGSALPGLKEPIRQIVAKRAMREKNFKTTFIANPVATARDYSVLPGVEGIVDFLKIIVKHPDPALAGAAQDAINSSAK